MSLEQTVQSHYGAFGAWERIATAIAALKTERTILTPDDLAPFDQLHTGGAGATRSLIARLAPSPAMHVLDVGSGLGGPARMLAAATGARVTGLDLTPHFVAAANRLTAETNQTERVAFRQGSALAMPFGDGTFDAAWHIHMSMNIVDKPRLYGEIHRVLKPGARFALYDPIRGDGAAVAFPVPWAATADGSDLRRRSDMMELLQQAGFAVEAEFDGTADGLAWFAAMAAAEAAAPPSAAAQAAPRGDPRHQQMFVNHRRNLETGAVAILGVVAHKPA
jgi:SAM-dependent methyltransferase